MLFPEIIESNGSADVLRESIVLRPSHSGLLLVLFKFSLMIGFVFSDLGGVDIEVAQGLLVELEFAYLRQVTISADVVQKHVPNLAFVLKSCLLSHHLFRQFLSRH